MSIKHGFTTEEVRIMLEWYSVLPMPDANNNNNNNNRNRQHMHLAAKLRQIVAHEAAMHAQDKFASDLQAWIDTMVILLNNDQRNATMWGKYSDTLRPLLSNRKFQGMVVLGDTNLNEVQELYTKLNGDGSWAGLLTQCEDKLKGY